MGPSRLLRRVFLDPLLSAMSDSSMVRTMYSCRGEIKGGNVEQFSEKVTENFLQKIISAI